MILLVYFLDTIVYSLFLPAVGYANNTSMNNVGSNGYVWSSALNESNTSNARNLNFNSTSANMNNNNRYYGYCVVGVVGENLYSIIKLYIMSFKLSKKQLLFDLYYAFECAKKHKLQKQYVVKFEKDLHNNLLTLCGELWGRTYTPYPSSCFIINHPKKREIFSANFRDRIVHHLYFNYTNQLFENTFINDSYSCRKNKGTHYGIARLEKHIRQESENYTKDTYILKMDIQAYFMNINRNILLEITNNVLDKMSIHYISKNNKIKWSEIIDFDFVKYLTKAIILVDPTINCKIISQCKEWQDLPKNKSLFYTDKDSGLPIGNLTSQLLSNVYLNLLDQYIKRELKCKHYGRYVDDFYIVSRDKGFLFKIIPLIEDFLYDKLKLKINKGKTIICNYKHGVEFLGAYVKPYRKYISNKTLRRIKKQCFEIGYNIVQKHNPTASINSFLGVFSHYKSHNIKRNVFDKFFTLGYFNDSFTKFILHQTNPYNICLNRLKEKGGN